MLIPDVNVVLAAFREDHAQFVTARAWLDRTLAAREAFSIVDPVVASFVRLATSSRVFLQPDDAREAFAFVRSLRAQRDHVSARPTPRHLDLFEDVVEESAATGDLIPDAHLAAIAREHSATIVSFDRDFARFRDIRWLNPRDEPPGTRSAR